MSKLYTINGEVMSQSVSLNSSHITG